MHAHVWETHGKAQRQQAICFGPAQAVPNKAVQAYSAKVEPVSLAVDPRTSSVGADSQGLAIFLLLLLCQTVLGLSHLELAVTKEGDEADTQVGASQVEGKVFANFLAGGVLYISLLCLR
jgi:hypothetical protein